jgi:hypothetical protein
MHGGMGCRFVVFATIVLPMVAENIQVVKLFL